MRIASANWTLGKKLMKVIHAQEQALVDEPILLFAFHLLLGGWTVARIEADYEVDQALLIPALRRLFYFGAPDAADPQHLLALARAAGYRITWIGNHADLNFSYLSQRARSRAASGVDDAVVARDGALNSVIVEAGEIGRAHV